MVRPDLSPRLARAHAPYGGSRRRRGRTMTSDVMPAPPRSAAAGTEMAALAPFCRDWRWSGTIEADGMGPGSPTMTGTGKAVCRLVQDGLWYVCDFEQDQRLLDGTPVLVWKLHWVAGWDAAAGEYRASSAD